MRPLCLASLLLLVAAPVELRADEPPSPPPASPPGMVPVPDEEPAPSQQPPVYVAPEAQPAMSTLPLVGGGSVRFSVGAAARTLSKVPFGGADFGFAAGGWGPRGAWYITSDVFAGASSERLTTLHLQLGIVIESKISTRFRFGVGASNGLLMVQRATNGRYMSQFTFATFLRISFDVLQWRNDGALFIGLQAGPGWAVPSTIVFAGTIGVGIRL
jgi:hypothetical protein